MSLVETVPSGVIGVGLGGVALALVMLAVAVRAHSGTRNFARGLAAGGWSTARPAAPAMGLVLGSALPPLLSLGGMVYAIQTSRAMILHSLTAADFGQKASFASTGLVHELGATFAGLLAFGVTLLLATASAGIAASARGRRSGLDRAIELAGRDRDAALAWATRPGPSAPVLVAVMVAFVALGLGPVIAGALQGTWLKVQALDAVANADPGVKAAIYERAQHTAGEILARGYLASVVGVACATAGSAILLGLASPSRARRRILGRPALEPPSSGPGPAIGAALFVAALALAVLARPMRREHETPWPPGSASERLGVETPALDGPDSLELGPLVVVSTTGLGVDRHPEDAAGVAAHLRAYRANAPLLHPGEPAPREVLLACAPDAASEKVFAAMEIAHGAGYDGARFVFETVRMVQRPVIGSVTLRNLTYARVSIATDGELPASAEILRPADAATCGQLAARVVARRRSGRAIAVVPHPPLERHQPLQE